MYIAFLISRIGGLLFLLPGSCSPLIAFSYSLDCQLRGSLAHGEWSHTVSLMSDTCLNLVCVRINSSTVPRGPVIFFLMWVRTRKIVRTLSLRHWKPTPLDGLDAKNSLIYTGGEVRGLTD